MKNEGGQEAGMLEGCTGPWRSMSVYFFMKPSSFLQHFPFPVCKAQLIGDWYENRRGAPNPIIFLTNPPILLAHRGPCSITNGTPNTFGAPIIDENQCI